MHFCACLTSIRRLKWQTPFEALRKKKPDVSHLRIFGCGAYVFLLEDVRTNKLSLNLRLWFILDSLLAIRDFVSIASLLGTSLSALPPSLMKPIFRTAPMANSNILWN